MHASSILVKFVRAWRGRTGADSRNSAYVSSRDHIVIGGCGRSGTTLVRVLLDSHPRICCGPESKIFLRDAVNIRKFETKFKLDSQVLNQAYLASQSRAEFIDRLAEICCSVTGKSRWSEKTPRNVHNLDFVFQKFSQAKFVHVLRDGRDVACSLRTHPPYRVKNGKVAPLNTWRSMKHCALRWRNSLVDAKRYCADPRFHTIRYEELVADQRKTITALLNFIGEAWDDALLAHSEVASNFRYAPGNAEMPEAYKPIRTSSVGRWRRDMTDDDKRIFKSIAGDLLIEHGYAADANW